MIRHQSRIKDDEPKCPSAIRMLKAIICIVMRNGVLGMKIEDVCVIRMCVFILVYLPGSSQQEQDCWTEGQSGCSPWSRTRRSSSLKLHCKKKTLF